MERGVATDRQSAISAVSYPTALDSVADMLTADLVRSEQQLAGHFTQLRQYVLEYLAFVLAENGPHLPAGPNSPLSPEVLRRLVRAARAELCKQYRHEVLRQAELATIKVIKLLVVSFLYRRSSWRLHQRRIIGGRVRKDPTRYRGSPYLGKKIVRLLKTPRPKPFHLDLPSLRALVSQGEAKRERRVQKRCAAGLFIRWLCLWRNIPYARKAIDEIETALRSVTRDEVIEYRYWLLVSRPEVTISRRQAQLADTLSYLRENSAVNGNGVRTWDNIPSFRRAKDGKCRPAPPTIALCESFYRSTRAGEEALKSYRSLLWIFLEWFAQRRSIPVLERPTEAVLRRFDLALQSITADDVREFQVMLAQSSFAGSRRKRIAAAQLLRRFCKFLIRKRILGKRVVSAVPALRADEVELAEGEERQTPLGRTRPGERRPKLSLIQTFLETLEIKEVSRNAFEDRLWVYVWWVCRLAQLKLRLCSAEAAYRDVHAAIVSASADDLVQFRSWLRSRECRLAVGTRTRCLEQVRRWYQWMAKSRIIAVDPTVELPRLRPRDIA